jgi:hypothetical protein
MLRVSAFIEDLEISFVAGANGHENIRLVVFAEVAAQTALSGMNLLHVVPPVAQRLGTLIAFDFNSSMSFVLCKLRLLWAKLSTTENVANSNSQKIRALLEVASRFAGSNLSQNIF